MSIIGDLFFSLRGDGKQLDVDVKKAGDQAGTSFGARMSASLKKSWSGGEIGKGLVQGLGLAGGLGAARLFSSAISTVTDVLGDATQAALAEEVSIQKLTTALKANIPNWNGQTDAIEKVLKARMALGFSDDEQRESLALLVVATKDANKALAVQRVAMDLSRLKGISLKEASEALIKVEAGQFRALKALGIQLPKNATATQALAAVQKVAAGQAEDWADTNTGKLLVSQVKIGEAMEVLGEKGLPLVVGGLEAAAEVAITLSDALNVLTGEMKLTNEEQVDLGESLLRLASNFPGFGASFEVLADQAKEGMREARAATGDFAGKAEDDMIDVEGAMGGVGDASGDLADDVKADTKVITRSWEEMRDDLIDAAEDLIDQAFDPIEARDRLIATNAEMAAARRVLASKTATAAEIRDAELTLHSATRDTAEAVLVLAEAGERGSKAYNTGIANLKTAIKNATGPTKTYLQGVLDKILELERVGRTVPINFTVQSFSPTAFRTNRNRAAGGPVTAGMPYIVGERRAELFVPSVNGTVLPRVPSGGAMMGMAGPTINLTVNTGSDVSPLAARHLGQTILDVVVDGLREQTARVP